MVSLRESSRLLADQGEQEITVRMADGPIYLDADPVRIVQVIGNVMNNACRYSDRGGRVRCTLGRDGDHAVVTIEDDGIGIPCDQLDGIFELFAQVDRSPERSRGGLGIGLHLTRQLVEMHGGTIRAHSEGLDRGSAFVIRLPIAGSETSGTSRTLNGNAPHANRPSQRMLIVDDNVDSAESLATLLSLSGHETGMAHDGDAQRRVLELRQRRVIAGGCLESAVRLRQTRSRRRDTMFSHVMVGTNDLDASKKFYDAVLGTLGIGPGFIDDGRRIFYLSPTGAAFAVSIPIDGAPASAANGGTVGFVVQDPATIDAWHAAGVANGGTTCEDPPGVREGGLGKMYLAYLRDPSGNKLCALHRMG